MFKNLLTALKNKYYIAGLVIYIAAIVIAAALILIDSFNSIGLNVKAMITPLVAALFVGALGIGYKIASKGSARLVSILGTVALATLLTFIGFFAVVGVAWFSALAHAV